MTSTTVNPFIGKAFTELFSEYKAAYRITNSSDDDNAVNAGADRMSQIEEVIWTTPAANVAEAHLKLEIASRDYAHGSLIPEHALQSVLDDTRRLLTGGAAPLFDPKLWVSLWAKDGGGYAVTCDQLNIVQPANPLPRTAELLAEVEQGNNREALIAYIAEQGDTSPADQFKALQDDLAAIQDRLAVEGLADEEVDRLADQQLEAMKALLLYPAPNMAAMTAKLEQFILSDCSGYVDDHREPILAAILADAKRFTSAN